MTPVNPFMQKNRDKVIAFIDEISVSVVDLRLSSSNNVRKCKRKRKQSEMQTKWNANQVS